MHLELGKNILREETVVKTHFVLDFAFNFLLLMHISVMFPHLEE